MDKYFPLSTMIDKCFKEEPQNRQKHCGDKVPDFQKYEIQAFNMSDPAAAAQNIVPFYHMIPKNLFKNKDVPLAPSRKNNQTQTDDNSDSEFYIPNIDEFYTIEELQKTLSDDGKKNRKEELEEIDNTLIDKIGQLGFTSFSELFTPAINNSIPSLPPDLRHQLIDNFYLQLHPNEK